MSNNLLGKDENLNAVQPNFVTGGESLSELLSNPKCPLRTLNVSCWSTGRCLSGVVCVDCCVLSCAGLYWCCVLCGWRHEHKQALRPFMRIGLPHAVSRSRGLSYGGILRTLCCVVPQSDTVTGSYHPHAASLEHDSPGGSRVSV